ncbi:GFA family protein [Planktotalea sp.]|uniref:GFA family protein n=1 Tax=Planktotalea sp. TaxID=2029877 RepID=UPI003F6AE701
MREGDIAVTGTPKTFSHSSKCRLDHDQAFCSICDTPLFTQNSARAGMLVIRAGLINEHEEFAPKANVYTSRKMKATVLDDTLKAFNKMPS